MSRWMASPSTSPRSAVVSARPPDRLRLAQRAIRRSGNHHVGGAQVLHHRSAHLGLLFATLRIWATVHIIDLMWTAWKVLEPRDG